MKVYILEYKSLLSGEWVKSYLGTFTSIRRAKIAARSLPDYETRVVEKEMAAG